MSVSRKRRQEPKEFNNQEDMRQLAREERKLIRMGNEKQPTVPKGTVKLKKGRVGDIKVKISSELPIITKYRPNTLEEVVGHTAVVNSLHSLFKSGRVPHAFLFEGGSGTGKTTFARIIAKKLDCTYRNIIEVDAAVHASVDSIRQLISGLGYRTPDENPIKFVIMDECHRLSVQGWDALLKTVEDPPSHVYFVFCTTEGHKVPKTLQTRCIHHKLQDVVIEDLVSLIEYVAAEESLEVAEEYYSLIAKGAQGSPRHALTLLAKVGNCKDEEEIKDMILSEGYTSADAFAMCRLVADSRSKWFEVRDLYKKLDKEGKLEPERLRITIAGYLKSCVLSARSNERADFFLSMLDGFKEPIYNKSTGKVDLLLMLGRRYFVEE